jgi:Alpha/beta hydrolase domain
MRLETNMKLPGLHDLRASTALVLAGMVLVAAGCGGHHDDSSNPTAVSQGIFKIVINSATDPNAPSQSPTFGGMAFGNVGAYEKIRGEAFGRLDPKDPHNSGIVDIQLAPRDSNGMVEYSMDFFILKPVDLSKGNHKIFYEINNRGSKQFGMFNESGGGNNPTTPADAGQAFLMNQGYTIVWSGWDPSVPTTDSPDLLRIHPPIATNPDGSSITGPDYEYIENDNQTTTSFVAPYNTSTTDTTKATLTVRAHLTDPPTTVPSTGWAWTAPNTMALLPANTPFAQSAIYELVYTAKDPYVAGVGFAATRDMASFLRNAQADTLGTPNPLAGDPQRIISWSLSQPSRYMNDFIWLGFNQDFQGKQVFDGVFNWVGAGDGVDLNYRFAHPSPTERNRQDHLYAEASFPFSYSTLTDPFTGKTDGRNVRCTQSNTCPKIMNINSANEYWVKAGSLLHTDLQGNDLADPVNVRNYLLSGLQHAGPAPANSLGVCQQFGNTTDPNPALRALFEALDQWLDGTQPPASAVPKQADNTAVFTTTGQFSPLGIGTVPQTSLNWPNIPDVLYTGLVTVRNLFNFGPQQFSQGILSINPPQATGNVYPSLVSKIDADGNEIAGIRLPPVSAPVSTTTGWNLRSAAFGGNDGCESTGSLIPFAPTAAARTAKGDSRLSLNERYSTHAGYVAAVTAAANALQAQRLLLPADVLAYIQAAQLPISVINNPVYGSYSW